MFKEEDDASLKQKAVPGAGSSARAQKWLDQLVQVESRMLSNWEEFSAHRNDVQYRLAELSEAVRRKQEPHLEGEVEKCTRRLQQLTQSNEETLCRVGDLKTAVENGQESLEGLRGRVSTKLQELGSSFEEHKKDLLSRVSEELHAESTSSKRQSKALAEELLRKMAELNQKLGENMTSVEEESISRFEGLRGDVQALAKRLDSAPRPEVELRKTEAYFESQLRSLRTEMHSQLEELVASASRSESARVKGVQDTQDLTQRLEKLASDAAAGKQFAERLEAQLQELRVKQRAELEDHLERLREEIAVKAGKESKVHSEAMAQLIRKMQSSEEALERCCETSSEVEVLKIADGERAMLLEQLSRTCNELAESRQGFLAEVDTCRSANRQLEDSLRRMDARVESLSSTASHCSEGVADIKATAREAEKSQVQFREMLEQRNSELQELLERRAYESSTKMEALRLADAERQRQLEQVSRACETLAEARQGIVAEVESCRSIDRQLEEALRRLDSRVERASATALQSSEGVADVKAFARELSEKAMSQCRDFMEKRSNEVKELLDQQASEQVSKMEALKQSDSECHQQLDFLSRALADLSEARRGIFAEVESCQSSDRKLEDSLRRMENKLERLSSMTSQCSEGLAEAKALAQQSVEKAQLQSAEQLELRIRELKEHLKHLRDELSSSTAKEAKQQSDALAQMARKQELSVESLQAGTTDLRRNMEAQFRRQEQLERQGSESAAALQAVQVLVVERGQQLERISKTCTELSEARKGMVTEVENCRSIQRQLEDALHRVDARLESVSSVAAQCSGGVVDVKAFASTTAEKARSEAMQQSREMVENKGSELKELVERKVGDLTTKLEALKLSSSEHQQQLEQLVEQRKGMMAEVEQCRTSNRQLEDALRSSEVRAERQGTQLAQAMEGILEAKSTARDVSEKIGQRCREVLEVRSIELKDLIDQRAADNLAKLEALRISDTERNQQLQHLSKTCADLAESNRGSAAEIESCQSIDRKLEEALRRVAAQSAEGTSEMKVFAREAAEKTVQQCKEMLEHRCSELKESLGHLRQETSKAEKDTRMQREEFTELKKQNQSSESTQELLKRQTLDTAAEVQALKASDLEKSSQLERISRSLVEFSEMKKGIYADLEACRSVDRSLEASLRTSDEKISSLESQCHEGLVEVKSFAQEVADKALKAATAELEETRRGVRAELQGSQAAERQLETRLERVFAIATQCSEGLGEVKAFARDVERATQQLKEQLERRGADTAARLEALKVTTGEHAQQLEQLSKSTMELPERITEARRGLSVELEKCQSMGRQFDEAQRRCEMRLEKVTTLATETSTGLADAKVFAQQSRELTEQRVLELKELIEHQAAESSPKLEALRSQCVEHGKQLQGLSEARRGLIADVEKCQSANRRLEEELHHIVGKIEKVTSSTNQTLEGLAEVKTFARESSDKAQMQSRQLVESSMLEMKEQIERRSADASSKIEALKASEVDQQQQLERLARANTELTEMKKGLLAEVEKCQAMDRQFEEALRRMDGKVERVAEVVGQCSEGLTEVKTFARQAAENVVVQSRDLLEQRTAELKARSEAANEELRALRLFVGEEAQRQIQASRAEASEREHRLSSKLMTQAQEAQELRTVLDEQLKRQENLSSELREAQEVFQSKVSKVSSEFAEQKDGLKKYITDALRKSEQKLQALTAQPRVLALVMDELEGVVRGVTQRELQVFQREALDSMEWKLERCVQWLHGANVKLGLNPQGTLFSTDRFREMLFDDAEPTTPGSHPQSARARVRSASRGRS